MMYERYERLAKEKGVTNFQVAKAVGITQSTLSEWKHGKYQPKLPKLKKLAAYFGVPITYFTDVA